MNREQLAIEIKKKLTEHKENLRSYWLQSSPVHHLYLDNLLPEEWANACYNALPEPEMLQLRDTIKERKHVGVSLEKYNPLVGEILFAFQDAEILKIVSEITGVTGLIADQSLYGSGISMMLEGDFLLPHLDNSHDGDGNLYRVLNALYYVTPGWPEDKGGNLELWTADMKQHVEIQSCFNRLVLMETNMHSIHSVNKVLVDGKRACVSNYYFSKTPVETKEYIHKTTFYARPEDSTVKKMRISGEGKVKNLLSKIFTNKTTQTKHRRK